MSSPSVSTVQLVELTLYNHVIWFNLGTEKTINIKEEPIS